MNNYTVTTESFEVVGGTWLYLTVPTITLTIIPDEGYEVDAGDFVLGDVNPAVTGVVFTNSGDNVIATGTINPTYIMPSGATDLPIDIDGFATLIAKTVSGNIVVQTANTNLVNATIPFSFSGNSGETIQITSTSIAADSGYSLNGTYATLTTFIDPTNAYPTNYNIDTVNTEDVDGNVIISNVTITYVIPETSVSGDIIYITAEAQLIVVPLITYTSYLVATAAVQAATNLFYAQYRPESIDFQIYGEQGASVTITVYDTTNAVQISQETKVFGAPALEAGYLKMSGSVPAVAVDTDYTFTFSGDIDPGFSQPNPVLLQQRDYESTLTIATTAVTGYTITQSPTTPTITGSQISSSGLLKALLDVTYIITSTTPGNLVGTKLGLNFFNDFTNSDSGTNGGMAVIGTSSIIGGDTEEMRITYSLEVTTFGTADVTMSLDLTSNLRNTTP